MLMENSVENSDKLAWEAKREQYGFTPKEMETTMLVSEGYSNQEIAHKMDIAVNTVKKHIYSIFNKVGVENRTHLIYKILKK